MVATTLQTTCIMAIVTESGASGRDGLWTGLRQLYTGGEHHQSYDGLFLSLSIAV